jgi:hypothetical protein
MKIAQVISMMALDMRQENLAMMRMCQKIELPMRQEKLAMMRMCQKIKLPMRLTGRKHGLKIHVLMMIKQSLLYVIIYACLRSIMKLLLVPQGLTAQRNYSIFQ